MHIRSAEFVAFKRFAHLTIEDLPAEDRLIVLCGPNGMGKSSVFEGFRLWHGTKGLPWGRWDPFYYQKQGIESPPDWQQAIKLQFHEPEPIGEDAKKAV